MNDRSLLLARQTVAVRQGCIASLPAIGPSTSGPWDLLLILYTCESDDRPCTRRDIAGRVQMTADIFDRWLTLLSRQEMIVVGPDPDDVLYLTATARQTLHDVLDAAARDPV